MVDAQRQDNADQHHHMLVELYIDLADRSVLHSLHGLHVSAKTPQTLIKKLQDIVAACDDELDLVTRSPALR
jgi:hypothetical protein